MTEWFRIEIWQFVFIVGQNFDYTTIIHSILPSVYFVGFYLWMGNKAHAFIATMSMTFLIETEQGLNWVGYTDCGYFDLIEWLIGLPLILIIMLLLRMQESPQ